MMLDFSKWGKLIIGFAILFLVLFIIYAQFFLLTPLKSDLEIKEQTLKSEEKLLDVISQKNVDDTKQVREETRELQKKVPVKPLQEQFILDLEKAENVSNSKIKSMSFTKNVEATTAETTENNTGTTTEDSGTSSDATVTEQQPGQANTNGLKKLTVSLSVESPTYEDLEMFISTLESFTRIVVVESINYSGGEEITSLEQVNEPLSYSLTISAYYMPELNDLIADLPKIDAPAPANKDNPLSSFADTTKSN
ncbi:pilus assembly protein PilO [Neobacillus sp. YX16]|uniref:pilus assembly protein PilO n=1 Tax=Neobacillus sp. YX16 TaxID=3047874 RepID=UPI0024C2AD2A|nr:pilus assembly protein PilO [Neobacillus sp. YX16]WHZ01899.1 pilus assembly protein PilO [Neobacillus sp. YX16]